MKVKIYLSMALFFLAPVFAFAADSATITAQANKLYKAGRFEEALKLYQQAAEVEPDSAAINFNLGAARFKKGDYAAAASAFEKAAVLADKTLEAHANYNLGNCKYKLGRTAGETDPGTAVNFLRQALDYYKRAMELNPKDRSPKINHELADKELKVLLEKLKQEEKDKKGGQKGQGEKKPSQSQTQGGQEDEKKAQPQEQDQKNKQEQPETAGSREQQAEEKSVPRQDGQKTKEMSAQEARMLLEGYAQEEGAPKKMDDTTPRQEAETLKDW